ncbi:MAG: Rha family transcriptional regulator [Desulfovibrio sp.]|nr:Rha family transcriptional regulator [Desulfovibrio sp.]
MSQLPAIALSPDAQGRPTCLSTDVALHFQKKHKNLLRDIDRIKSLSPASFSGLNFEPAEYTDKQGKPRLAYRLTRDAFSLLVMGMTGPAAIRWKLRYIEAFNRMEQALHQQAGSDLFLAGARAAAQRLAGEDRARLADCALALLDEGLSQSETGRLLGVSRWTVQRLKKRFGFMAMPKGETLTQGGLL